MGILSLTLRHSFTDTQAGGPPGHEPLLNTPLANKRPGRVEDDQRRKADVSDCVGNVLALTLGGTVRLFCRQHLGAWLGGQMT